jgi:hypothetical protein
MNSGTSSSSNSSTSDSQSYQSLFDGEDSTSDSSSLENSSSGSSSSSSNSSSAEIDLDSIVNAYKESREGRSSNFLREVGDLYDAVPAPDEMNGKYREYVQYWPVFLKYYQETCAFFSALVKFSVVFREMVRYPCAVLAGSLYSGVGYYFPGLFFLIGADTKPDLFANIRCNILDYELFFPLCGKFKRCLIEYPEPRNLYSLNLWRSASVLLCRPRDSSVKKERCLLGVTMYDDGLIRDSEFKDTDTFFATFDKKHDPDKDDYLYTSPLLERHREPSGSLIQTYRGGRRLITPLLNFVSGLFTQVVGLEYIQLPNYAAYYIAELGEVESKEKPHRAQRNVHYFRVDQESIDGTTSETYPTTVLWKKPQDVLMLFTPTTETFCDSGSESV